MNSSEEGIKNWKFIGQLISFCNTFLLIVDVGKSVT
jgi:hypothetical protein